MLDLPFKTYGDKHKKPILFLHGFLGSQYDFVDIIEGFKTTYFCISVDLPGHG